MLLFGIGVEGRTNILFSFRCFEPMKFISQFVFQRRGHQRKFVIKLTAKTVEVVILWMGPKDVHVLKGTEDLLVKVYHMCEFILDFSAYLR